jgi:hypothetical protein
MRFPGPPDPQRTLPKIIGERQVRVHRRGVRGLPGIGRAVRAVDRENVHLDGGITFRLYGWRDKPESATATRRGLLALNVQKSFGDSGGMYGYRRVHADLAAWGVPARPQLVRSLMRELGLEPRQPQPWRVSLTEGDGQEQLRLRYGLAACGARNKIKIL